MIINIITYKDQDIEISVSKNEVMWKAHIGDKDYGNSVILKSKKINDLVGTIASIVSNAVLTYETLKTQALPAMPQTEDKKETNEN